VGKSETNHEQILWKTLFRLPHFSMTKCARLITAHVYRATGKPQNLKGVSEVRRGLSRNATLKRTSICRRYGNQIPSAKINVA